MKNFVEKTKVRLNAFSQKMLRGITAYLKKILQSFTKGVSVKSMTNKPKKVILHCSASPDKETPLVNASVIDGWHKKRGWDGIGYHFVITRAGTIEDGRNPGKYGAHTYGHNENSLGVCWVGTKYPTDNQLREILNLYVLIYKTWKIDYTKWYGHHQFNEKKTCPGFSMKVFRKLLEYHHKLTLV